jgi:ABC-2 type transport system permease protein
MSPRSTAGISVSPPSPAPTFTRSAAAIARAEFTLLRRNATILVISIAVPIAMTIGTVLVARDAVDASGWAVPLTLLIALVLGMGVYMPATLSITARREDLYLKRLRTSEAGDAAIVGGVLAPLVVAGVAQSIIAVAAVVVFGGATIPALPLAGAAVLATVALALLAAIATTGLVRGTEQADAATMPFFAFFVLSAVWAAYESSGDGFVHLLLPGGALLAVMDGAMSSELAQPAMLGPALLGLAVLLAWCAISAFVVRRTFRWEPRR